MSKQKKIRRVTHRTARHPCWGWCAQRLYGIVDNLKLRGELPAEAEIEVISIIGLMYVPAGTYTATCQHRREYILRPVKGFGGDEQEEPQ
jgi:hypothetical protein